MSDLRVAIIQTEQVWENVDENLKRFSQKVDSLKEVDLIVLPEMFQTGFTMNVGMAESMEDSKSISWLKEKAALKSAAIYTSLLIQDGEKIFNRGVFVYPNGDLEVYDKRKCFGLAGEDKVISAGNEKKIVHYLGWRIQLNICYDLRFPEILRNEPTDTNLSSSYDVLLIVANWPEKRVEHWSALLKARSIENQCFAIGVNRVGKDENDLSYNGQSAIFNALGLDEVQIDDQEKCITKTLKKDSLDEHRLKFPFLRDQG